VLQIMNKQLTILALIPLAVACTPTPTSMPTLSSPTLNIQVIASATPMPQEIIPATSVQPTETTLPATEAAGTLWLQVLYPQDETVVNTPQVEVIGSTAAGAVVTINDEILIMNTDGQFKSTVPLEEGPNLIEVIASDEDGNETSLLLTVIYEP
jgi:Glucodextranase, domain B